MAKPRRIESLLFGKVDGIQAEKALWLAVLEEAGRCIRGRTIGTDRVNGRQIAMQEARRWITETQDKAAPGTFLWVCEHLKLDAAMVKRILLDGTD